MGQKPKLLGYYNYTVIMTYIGMLIGFIGIAFAFENNITRAVICLLVSGFFDMFDGAIASTRKRTQQEKCFGIQIDSFSDLVCFGVLPAIIVYSQSGSNRIVLCVSALYLLCALIRLAFFNVDEQDRQQNCSTAREIYYGLPVTIAALIIPIVYSAVCLFSWNIVAIQAIILLIMAILFLLPFQLRKPKLPGKSCLLLCGVFAVWFVIFVTRSL